MEINLIRDLEISKLRLSLSDEQLKAFDKIMEDGSVIHVVPEDKKESVRVACSFMDGKRTGNTSEFFSNLEAAVEWAARRKDKGARVFVHNGGKWEEYKQ